MSLNWYKWLQESQGLTFLEELSLSKSIWFKGRECAECSRSFRLWIWIL